MKCKICKKYATVEYFSKQNVCTECYNKQIKKFNESYKKFLKTGKIK